MSCTCRTARRRRIQFSQDPRYASSRNKDAAKRSAKLKQQVAKQQRISAGGKK